MDLRGYLLSVASHYDATAPFDSTGQRNLAAGVPLVRRLVPGGLLVRHGGGKGRPTQTPWIGVLDPDETSVPQTGIYAVYLFAADLSTVVLTLIQGTDVGKSKSPLSLKALRGDAAAIRSAISDPDLTEFPPRMDLKTSNSRQARYTAANIAAKTYELSSLPPEELLRRDLKTILRLYRHAIQAKRQVLLSAPGKVYAPGAPQTTSDEDLFRDFKPKDDGDYEQHIRGRKIQKSRGHESLIQEFGTFAISRGLSPATNVHPRDLTLILDGEEWLIEAKTVGTHPNRAVREAIGQLFEYEHFLYKGRSAPRKAALFTDSIGDGFVELLESLGIGSIWKENGDWIASDTARRLLQPAHPALPRKTAD